MDRVPVAEAVPWVVEADQVVAVVAGAAVQVVTAHNHKTKNSSSNLGEEFFYALISAASVTTAIAGVVALMTSETRRSLYRRWMTGLAGCAAVINPAFFAKGGMLASEFCICPTRGIMTTGTIQAKCARMPTRVTVTGGTSCAEPLKYFVDVTALALHIDVCTGERELGFVVIKRGIVPT